MNHARTSLGCLVLLLPCVLLACAPAAQPAGAPRGLHELNAVPSPPANRVTAIVGATLIDGTVVPPVADSVVVIRCDRITAVGPRGSVTIPPDANIIDAAGL